MILKTELKTRVDILDSETLAIDTGLYLLVQSCATRAAIRHPHINLVEEVKRANLAEIEHKIYGDANRQLAELEVAVFKNMHFAIPQGMSEIKEAFSKLRETLRFQ